MVRRAHAGGLVLLLLAVLGAAGCKKAGPYPNHAIEFVVPFASGGPADLAARAVQPRMSALLGVPVTVVNKPGNGGAAATSTAAKAPADGYHVLATTNGPLTVLPATGSALDYSAGKFIALGSFASDVAVVAVRSDTPWKTLEQFVNDARGNAARKNDASKDGGKLSYGSPGHGTVSYLMMELLGKTFGFEIAEVQFDGAAPARDALLNGQVDVIATALSSVAAQVRSGELRLLVQSGADRSARFPDVPTTAEKGLTPQSPAVWAGLYVPAATPREIAEKLAGALAAAMQDPAVFEAFDRAGLEVDYRNPDAAHKVLQSEKSLFAATWRELAPAPALP